jgi:hypothetical protein
LPEKLGKHSDKLGVVSKFGHPMDSPEGQSSQKPKLKSCLSLQSRPVAFACVWNLLEGSDIMMLLDTRVYLLTTVAEIWAYLKPVQSATLNKVTPALN